MRDHGRPRPGHAGSALVEVLVAAAVLTVGALAALAALGAGFRGVDAAHRSSVALLLAEERLEEVRAVALRKSSGAGRRLDADRFPDESYGSVAGRPGYRRTTEIALEPGGVRDIARVSVTVFYRAGGAETFERLSTLLTLP